MQYIGEIISLVVAFSWTITALFAEVGSKRLGSLQMNVIRMLLSLLMLGATLWWFTGSPYPLYADGQAWLWLSLSGFVGYLLGDYCLFNSYIWIGSRFGQLFMTLAPPTAALFGWILLGETLAWNALLGMLVTLTGIGISVLNKGTSNKLSLKLPLKGVLFGIGAGVGQGVGLVLSKVGMNYYEMSIPVGEEMVTDLLPFASTFIRAVTGAVGFLCLMGFQKQFHTLATSVRDFKGMNAAVWATITGPFIGVSLSLMAVQYTEAGIASTLMALTPVFIIWPAHFFFGQKVTFKEVIGACISVAGVSLFFI
ncbi:MAG: DMT family transporter [Bacteroidaceae bacterium]|nr:DMT family transporter [Bacteroidaceae bacterium]MBQ8769949.1 DMT family transporter [Bacteroides sp.]MBR4044073.1 DMT family transporter [Bacteroidaceae bacterium]